MNNHLADFWLYDQTINKVRCHLCPQYCVISESQLGLCKTRQHINQQLIAINYGEVTSYAVDPIEKKPLYHFKPGSTILSIGTFGCNMTCSFCQNYTISQHRAKSHYVTTEVILEKLKGISNNAGVAFTYNEPFMWYEYIYDTAKKIKEYSKDISIVIVSNGYINPEPLKKLLPYIDAVNIDLKAYTESYYRQICGAKLDPVLETIEIASQFCHVEVTTLMVTGENDSQKEIEDIAKFLGRINPNIPLHLSRYFPTYKMTQEATEIDKIKKAKKIAETYLNYVYIGNVVNIDNHTYCYHCGEQVIHRDRYQTTSQLISSDCPKCHKYLPIVL